MSNPVLKNIDESLKALEETIKSLKNDPHGRVLLRDAEIMKQRLLKTKEDIESRGAPEKPSTIGVHLAATLDEIADKLESKGLLKEARDLDVISNTLEVLAAENPDAKATVGINEFVKRQTKPDFAGTKVTPAQLESIRKRAEQNIKRGASTQGSQPFIKYVTIHEPSITVGYARVTPENEHLLKSRTTKREGREFEEAFEQRYFDKKDVKPMPSDHVLVVMFTREQLESEKSNPTGADYDIISINAEGYGKSAPRTPETLMRNAKGPESGGSGEKYTPDMMTESKRFWENHAMVL